MFTSASPILIVFSSKLCGSKFNITSDFGGWMQNYIPTEEVLDLIRYVDDIQLQYGAPTELTNPNTREVFEIEKKGIAVGLKLLRSEVRHLGTELNLNVLKNIYEAMKDHIDYKFKCEVKDIVVEDNKVTISCFRPWKKYCMEVSE